MQQGQGLQQDRRAFNLGQSKPLKQRRCPGCAACQRCGVAERGGLCLGAEPGFQNHHRNPAGCCRAGHAFECSKVPDPFQIQPDRGDPGIGHQHVNHIRQTGLGLIAQRDHSGHRQPPCLHGQVDRDVRGLRHNRHAPVARNQPMLIGPQGHPVEPVDKTITIGAKDRHPSGGRDQLGLQIRRGAVGHFGKARGKTHRAPGPHF